MNPEISVIVPTYNSEEYIAKALESVFAQTHQNLEIVLIDDASTDSTVSIARSFRDKRLRVIENSCNRGVSYGRNRGIKLARGKWIALLDSDDWYAPERLEKLLQVAKQRSADLVADDLFLIRDRQQQPWSTLLQENHQATLSPWQLIDAVKFVTSDRPTPIGAKRNWSLGYIKALIRKEFLLENNIQYQENISVGEDFTFYLECLWHYARFYLVNQPYYYYRTRESSLSSRTPIEHLSQSCDITQKFIDKEVRSPEDLQLHKVLQQNLVVFHKRLAYYYLIESLRQKNIWQAIELIITAPHVAIDIFKKSNTTLIDKLLTKVRLKDEDSVGVNVSTSKNQPSVSTKRDIAICNSSQADEI